MTLTPILITLLTATFALLVVHAFAARFELLDNPSVRKKHVGSVPLIGGISVFIGAWFGLLLMGLLEPLWLLFVASLLVLGVGVQDDRVGLSARVRFLVEFVAVAILAFGAGDMLHSLGDLFGLGVVELGWFAFPFTLIAVVGVINALNMIDGIDGLAGSLSFLALAVMGVLALGAGRTMEAWVAILFAVAIVPYLLCNLGVCGDRRRVFFGDAGTMLLGFVIAWLTIVLSQPASSGVVVFAPVTALWLFAIPLVDTVSIMLRRLLEGQSPFLPDRNHLHHIMLRMGYRDHHALLFIMMASVVLGGVGLWMEFAAVAEWKRFAAFLIFFALYFVVLLNIWQVLSGVQLLVKWVRRVVWRLFSPLLELSPTWKRAILLVTDGVLVYGALALALLFRFGSWSAAQPYFEWPLGMLLLATPLLAFPLFAWFGLYRAVVRFFGSQALWAVVGAVTLYALLYAGGWAVLRSSGAITGMQSLPLEVIAMHAVLLLLAVGGSRMLGRKLLSRSAGMALHSPLQSGQANLRREMRVVIVGAGEAGRQLAGGLRQSPEVTLLGFVDGRADLHDRLLQGRPVITATMLEKFVEQHGVTDVLLADERLDAVSGRAQRNALLQQLGRLHVRVRLMPTLDAVARWQAEWRDFQELDVADLLQRNPVEMDCTGLEGQIAGKTVLVLGAGGTIGSELCRQLLSFQPKRLLLYESNELALHAVYQKLLGQLQQMERSRSQGDQVSHGLRLVPQLLPILGSVQDSMRMQELMHTWKPDLLYHAAAYKHVPMVEHNPAEGLKNNLFGTLTAARAAMEAGVSSFVLISTDKAVRPTNIMGASKRLAEMVLQALAAEETVRFDAADEPAQMVTNRTHFSMVRFGNVLGSSGSVVPLFREQIQQGGPITLTDPEVTRYFMSIPEAAQLVLQAGASKNATALQGAELFVLDMGEPVKIIDIARRMVELSGLRVRDEECPQGDIEIAITGLRPGEKRHEELLIGDNLLPTDHLRILKACEEYLSWSELQQQLHTLRILTDNNDIELIRKLLTQLITGYQPDPKVVDWVYLEQTS